MIVRHFLNWVRTAPASERADATRALARAYLISNLSNDDRAAAEGALLMLLDDSSPLVREAMAQVFARSIDAPPAIVQALSLDQASVSSIILEHSPLLIDADLVDVVATACPQAQAAVARRLDLPAPVCAAIAEVGCATACLDLLQNSSAELAHFSLDRLIARHGELAAVRETVLAREDLPSSTRLALVSKLSEALKKFVITRDWLSADRAARIADEACARATVNVAAQARGADLDALVRHLREGGQLTAGLILRALLSGNIELFEHALAELSGLPIDRVGRLSGNPGGSGFHALMTRAGLPPATFPAFREALAAMGEIGFVDSVGGVARLRRRMVERVLTRCENYPAADIEPLLTLLRRFATESAREEARLFCDELVAHDGIGGAHDEDFAYRDDELIAA